MCIGNHFAMMEMQLLLSLLVSRFDFVYEGTEPPPADPLVTLRPREGMPMNVQVRAIKVPR
jgi:cytochrome P450